MWWAEVYAVVAVVAVMAVMAVETFVVVVLERWWIVVVDGDRLGWVINSLIFVTIILRLRWVLGCYMVIQFTKL